MKPGLKKIFKAFSLEMPLYAVLMAGYAFFVLHYMGDWLFGLFRDDRKLYAATALGLIVGQGLLLDMVARGLLALVKVKQDK